MVVFLRVLFSASNAMQHINLGTEYNALLLQMIPVDLCSAVPLRHFYALHDLSNCQTPTLMPACQAGSQFVPFYVFSMTQHVPDPTTYCMRGGHANH